MISFNNNVIQNLDLARKLNTISDKVEHCASELLEVIKNNGKIYIAGNAGAGSNGEHFVSELVGKFYTYRRAVPAISLNSDNTTITCIANDYGYSCIFERQLEALFDVNKDIFIGMSSSGNSDNIIRAVNYLNEIGGKSISLLGKDGGYLNNYIFENNYNIIIPSYDTPRIQEAQMFVLHYWAEYIEYNLFMMGESNDN